ncbi:hypothetical protein RND81_06G091000 [Saponaria officinalis]
MSFYTHSICCLLKFNLMMYLYMLYVCFFTLFLSSKLFPGHILPTVVFKPQMCTTPLLGVETFWVYIDIKHAIHPSGLCFRFTASVAPFVALKKLLLMCSR